LKLTSYNSKRDFSKTKEPKGEVKNTTEKRFVVQFHQARKDHYDFRLEHKGVLVSWAVPKGFPKMGERHLAVKVEDHPLDYMNFEGTIPKGEYGAGKVEIYDLGHYKTTPALSTGLKDGKFKIALVGKKIDGVFAMVKMKDENWLIIKENIKKWKQIIILNKKPTKILLIV